MNIYFKGITIICMFHVMIIWGIHFHEDTIYMTFRVQIECVIQASTSRKVPHWSILPGCTHKPLQAWGPLSTVVPLYFWSVFWIVLSSSHRWNFSVSSSCLGRNGRQKGMHFGSTKICRARIVILLWGTFQQLAGEKLVSETLESLLHGL